MWHNVSNKAEKVFAVLSLYIILSRPSLSFDHFPSTNRVVHYSGLGSSSPHINWQQSVRNVTAKATSALQSRSAASRCPQATSVVLQCPPKSSCQSNTKNIEQCYSHRLAIVEFIASFRCCCACGGMSRQGCAPSPLLRHAVIVDAESYHSSAVKSDDLLETARIALLSPISYAGNVSQGSWRASPQSSTSASTACEDRAEADSRHYHAAFTTPNSPNRAPSEQLHVPHPGQSQSAYVFGGGGGVGLIFKTCNAQHLVCGIIPGGNCTHVECKPRAPATIPTITNLPRQALLTSTAAWRWATSCWPLTASRCVARA